MKIINEDLLKLKIEVLVRNKIRFQDIVLMVDRPKFLKEIEEIRKLLKIQGSMKDIDPQRKGAGVWQLAYREWVKKNPVKAKLLKQELNKLLNKLKYLFYYSRDIAQAILFGVVVDICPSVPPVKIFTPNSTIPCPTVAILPTPRTTYDEVKEALRHAKKIYKQWPELKTVKTPDTYSNIRKYRYWYWERLIIENGKPKKYNEIAKEWCKKHEKENTTYIEVIKGVKEYKNLLK